MVTDLCLASIAHDYWTDDLRIQVFIPFVETLIGDNFIPIIGYLRCGYGYGYFLKVGIGTGMGIWV